MKKTYTATIVIALILSGKAAVAQTAAGNAPPDPEVRIAKIADDLTLNDAQKVRFRTILTEEHGNLMASMKEERQQNTAVQAAHLNHQKIEAAAMEKLKPILTEDQYQRFQKIVEAEAYARHHPAPTSEPSK